MWSCRYTVIPWREKRGLILGAIRGETRLYSPKRVWSRSPEVATRISSPCVIRGEITTWGSSDRCGQYVSDSVSDHFDPWWYRGFGNSVRQILYERSRLRGSVQFTYLDQITDGPDSTIRNCSRIVSAVLSIRRQFVVMELAVNDLVLMFLRKHQY